MSAIRWETWRTRPPTFSDSGDIIRDVVLTKKVWERSQRSSHFKTVSNSF